MRPYFDQRRCNSVGRLRSSAMTVPFSLDQRLNLAREVRARRKELGYSRDAVAARGGPSDTTRVRIEQPDEADARPINRTTLLKLDRGLSWQAGSAEACLRSGSPTPIPSAVSDAPGLHQLDWVEVRMATIDAAVRAIASVPPEYATTSWAIELSLAASALMAAHTTEVLERVGGPGRTVPPLLAQTYLPYLVVPPEPPADGATALEKSEYSERLYRRWLANQGQLEGLTTEQVAEFTSRWHAKQSLYDYRSDRHR